MKFASYMTMSLLAVAALASAQEKKQKTELSDNAKWRLEREAARGLY